MPIPDVIFVDDEPAEPVVDARAAEVQRAVNALLAQQQTCGKICCSCAEKCSELETWINLDTGGE
jgi:hypothetical protein